MEGNTPKEGSGSTQLAGALFYILPVMKQNKNAALTDCVPDE